MGDGSLAFSENYDQKEAITEDFTAQGGYGSLTNPVYTYISPTANWSEKAIRDWFLLIENPFMLFVVN